MKKNIIKTGTAIILTLLIFAQMTLPITATNTEKTATEQAMPFIDISEFAWYCGDLSYAYNNKLTYGTSEKTYSPSDALTRGQCVTLMGRMFATQKEIDNAPTSPFNDVNEGTFFEKYVNWAYQKRIVSGITSTTFCPSKKITREEFATMLNNAITIYKMKINETTANPYNDVGKISKYALPSVLQLSKYGIFKGDGNGNFNPQKTMTRIEGISVMSRVYAKKTAHTHGYVYATTAPATYITPGYDLMTCSCGSYYKVKTSEPNKANQIYDGNKSLTYDQTNSYLRKFEEMYPEIVTIGTAGYSVEKREILYATLGRGTRYIFMNGNLHGREYITTNYLLEILDTYSYLYSRQAKLGGYDVRTLLDIFTIVMIPCSNPDSRIAAMNGDTYIKANANDVDLNDTFSATNTTKYQPETKAVLKVLSLNKYEVLFDCHNAGNVIYYTDKSCSYSYNQRALNLVNKLCAVSKYRAMAYTINTNDGLANYGRSVLDIPSMTVEMYPYTTFPIQWDLFSSTIWNYLSTMPLITMRYLLM